MCQHEADQHEIGAFRRPGLDQACLEELKVIEAARRGLEPRRCQLAGVEVEPDDFVSRADAIRQHKAGLAGTAAGIDQNLTVLAADSVEERRRCRHDHSADHRHPRPTLVELLHPDRRSVSKGIDRIVVGHRGVAEDGAPKTDVNHTAFRRDGDLHFLDGRTIGDRAVFARNGRTARARWTCRCSRSQMSRLSQTVTRVSARVSNTPAPAIPGAFATASTKRAASLSEPTRNAAVAAVQHDPVIDTLGGEDLANPARSRSSSSSNWRNRGTIKRSGATGLSTSLPAGAPLDYTGPAVRP